MHPLIPESPRWLITERKYAEAASLINKIRKIIHKNHIRQAQYSGRNNLKSIFSLNCEFHRECLPRSTNGYQEIEDLEDRLGESE